MSAESSLRALADAALPSLLAHLWSSTLFLALLLGVAVAARARLRPGARFALAFVAIVKFALPAAVLASAAAPLGRLWTTPPPALTLPLQVLAMPLALEPAAAQPRTWPLVAGAVWLAVALALVLRSTLTRRRLVALAVRTALPPSPREVAALTRARTRLGLRRSIDLARSAMPETPAVLRIFRPLVVLPAAGCDELSDAELESLLRHECAHVARHDNLMARVESTICALFWFHPLLWAAQRITAIERERACDEAAAGSDDERDAYLAALEKFCHRAIAPRLPGVSCMATARLKERIDHVMDSARSNNTFSARRATVVATAALALFTGVSAIVGDGRAFASAAAGDDQPYAVKLAAARAGDRIELTGSISDNRDGHVLAAPRIALAVGQSATVQSSGSGLEISLDVLPGSAESLPVEVAIRRDGVVVQSHTATVPVVAAPAGGAPEQYTGDPISLSLRDADLGDVLAAFGQITGLDVQLDPAVEETVTVEWHNVPWDQALESLLEENALTYRLEGATLHVTRK